MNTVFSRTRRIASVAAVTAALIVTAGCASPSAPDAGSGEATTLTVWGFDAKLVESLGTILEGYTEEHPEVTFEFVSHPDADYFRLLTTAWSADSGGPDLAQIKAYGVIESFVQAGNISPVDPASIPQLDAFSESSIKGVTSPNDGLLYAVPLGVEAGQIYYNVDIFEANGVDVPTSWKEFQSAAADLQAAGVIPIVWPVGDVVHGSLAAEIFGNARRGGAEFEAAFLSGEKTLDSAEFVDGLEMSQEMAKFTVDSPTAMTRDEATALFASGQAAMFASGAWNVGTLPGINADLNFDVFAMPSDPSWPVKSAATPSWSDGGMTMSSTTANPEVAADVLTWLSEQAPQQLYTDLTGKLPARDDVEVENPVLAHILENLREGGVNHFVNANLRYGSPSGTDLVGEGVQKLLLGTDAQSVADGIQAGIATWFVPTKG